MSTARERFEDVGKKIKRESGPSIDRGGRRLGPVGSPNSVTPCAACKLLRRRCAQECPFSPYFSPHEPQKFASVHKVFGASNVSKMLMEVPEQQRADAANSLVYEANIRMRDPVYGCMGAISALQQQVQALEMELQAVRTEILRHKLRQASVDIMQDHADLLALNNCEVSVAASAPGPAGSLQLQQQQQTLSQVSDVDLSSILACPTSSSANYSSVTTTSHNVTYYG